MKKLLAILLVVATLFCVVACGDDTDTTTTTTQSNTTTTTNQEDNTTTTVENDNTTTTVEGETTTTVEGETTTTVENTTTTTKKVKTTTAPSPVVGKNGTNINGVDPSNAENQSAVVDNVFTSSNGGIQLLADGWRTYALYNISMVPAEYNNKGATNAICVAVYPKGTPQYDDAVTFENKTEADFVEVLQQNLDAFGKTTITSNGMTFTCYKAVVENMYYVWVFQTPEAKYFINFMQVDGMADMHAIGNEMMKSIVIYK